jgi:glycosyltransferase involved in cell wall biosynthesis
MTRLDRHHDDLLRLTELAEAELAAGRRDGAAAYAQIAGQLAWTNHTGVFASPRVEAVLAQLADALPAARRDEPPRDDPREVLHVLTQAYATGGSTREVECWVEQDTDRRHRVCVTRQGPGELPASLAAVLPEPGAITRADLGRGGLMQRAARLRALSATADVVVLHTHPYDVVPVIALGGAGTPPVVLVNQADHVFWLGTSVSDVVMHMRESGRDVATVRRGIEPARSMVAARPLMPRGRETSRADAKRALGIDPDVVLLVTAADASKYRPVGDVSFLDLVTAVLERHPEAQLVAAGPAPDGDWADAAERTGGRVQALGRLPDVTLLEEAADIYLDSFPFSSLTSLLETGSLGTPAVTYRGHPDDCLVLGADTPGVDDHLLCPADPDAFVAAVGELIADPAGRLELGDRLRRAIDATHTGDGWRAAMGAVYARAAELGGRPQPGPAPRETGALDQLVDAVMDRTGYSQGLTGALRFHLGLLPLRRRIAATRRLSAGGATPTLRQMLPESLLPRLGAWKRRLRPVARKPAAPAGVGTR